MIIVKKEKEDIYTLKTKEISLKSLKSLKSELAQKILQILSKKIMYPKQIAKELKMHEQKIYYHIRLLEKAGIIKIAKQESMQGATATYYELTEKSFTIRFGEYEKTQQINGIKNESEFLQPFIEDGKLDSLIIVGSPDPHGPEKARSRDGYYGMDLALFIGTFLNYVPISKVKLDTETRDSDLDNNLIIIGGPIVNKITEKINNNMPIRFHEGKIISTLSGNQYNADETGIIVKIRNPFSKNKFCLIIAGKRNSGTKAAILAFLQDFKQIRQGNNYNKNQIAKVVEGIDLDSDGIIDFAEFRE
ncbi:S-layer protein [Candidatus Woesearchaeota archaeon]|nr:S-layer protein [Candidatus Woesearchaeota archaeon]